MQARVKATRETHFPAAVIAATKMRLEQGQASVEDDRKHILNHIVKQVIHSLPYTHCRPSSTTS